MLMMILCVNDIFYHVKRVHGFHFMDQRLHDVGIDGEEMQPIVDDDIKLDIADGTALAEQAVIDTILVRHVQIECLYIRH